MSTTTEGPRAEELVTVRLTDEQADHLREALIFELPWDSVDAPNPRTQEEFVELLAVVTSRHEQLERLGWEPVGGVREFTDRADVLMRAASYLLDGAGDEMCHAGKLSPEAFRRQQLATRSRALAGYAIAEQLEANR